MRPNNPTEARGAATRRANTTATPGPQGPLVRRTVRRRGITSVLAMLFLILFAALALGFYAQTTLSSQVSGNERRVVETQAAAESGVQFVQHHLAALSIPSTMTADKAFEEIYLQLAGVLDETNNLGGAGKIIGYKPTALGTPIKGGEIRIPDQATDYISLGANGPKFRVIITDANPILKVKVIARSSNESTARGVSIDFQRSTTPYALIGINSLTMSAGAYTDSYDATKGAYSALTARSNGSIASNGIITLKNTSRVNGNLRYGPTASASIDPTAIVTGSVGALTKPMTYPSVTLPPAGTYIDVGDMNSSSGTSSYPGGTYVINNLTLSGTKKIIWQGPVKLYIKSSYTVTDSVSISTYNNLPANRILYFLPTCKTASWSGTNVCVGELYAPDTDFTVSGAVEKHGRLIAKSIVNSSSGGMHYDESLPAALGLSGFSPVPGSYVEGL